MEVWQGYAALVAAFLGLVLIDWRVRREIARSKQPDPYQPHKYIGLDEYRARQQKQRYRDRVS